MKKKKKKKYLTNSKDPIDETSTYLKKKNLYKNFKNNAIKIYLKKNFPMIFRMINAGLG